MDVEDARADLQVAVGEEPVELADVAVVLQRLNSIEATSTPASHHSGTMSPKSP